MTNNFDTAHIIIETTSKSIKSNPSDKLMTVVLLETNFNDL